MNQEEDPASSAATSDDQLRRINSQLGLDVASKLGFVVAKDLVSSEDLQVQVRGVALFAYSVHIKLVSTQAAQLNLHFCWRFENQRCCTSTRDLL